MMAVSDICCPFCLPLGKENLLLTGTGKFGYQCPENSDHIFQDTEALFSMKLKRKLPPKQAPKIQPNTSEYVLRIPNGLIEVLGKRFGEKLDSSVAAVLGVMTDPQAFVVVGEDTRRLQEIFSVKIPSADVLVGSASALRADRDQWKQQAEIASHKTAGSDSSAMVNASGDADFVQVSVKMDMDLYFKIRDKAKFNNMSIADYTKQILFTASANGWM
jgi:hypothetical protein